MIHARADYNRIQDPENKIPEDEPVILFRAQDKHFTKILEAYVNLIVDDPQFDYNRDSPIVSHLGTHIGTAINWREKNKDKVKHPDL